MKRNVMQNIGFGICFLILIGLTIHNCLNNDDFFIAPSYSILNLIAVVFISFYLVQVKTDERKAKESAEQLIIKIQRNIMCQSVYHIDSKDAADQALRQQRSIKNKLEVLTKYIDKFGCSNNDNVSYINNLFQECRRIVGDHITDYDYLLKSEDDIKNKLELIDDKLDEMRFQLYSYVVEKKKKSS